MYGRIVRDGLIALAAVLGFIMLAPISAADVEANPVIAAAALILMSAGMGAGLIAMHRRRLNRRQTVVESVRAQIKAELQSQ
jgi:hypothetical protein